MISLAISTYMSKDTHEKRLGIFKDSISSLLRSNFKGKIFVVDDGSYVDDHLVWLESLEDSRVSIIRNKVNSGISVTKNIGLKQCMSTDSDIFFLVDDDVIYKDKNWFTFYLNASRTTGLHHFSYGADVRPTGEDIKRDGVKLRRYKNLNGCMLLVTREMVKNIGYFKKFPNKYGYEHCNYTYRHNHFYKEKYTYDVYNSDKLLELHKLSEVSVGKSMVVNSKEVAQNGVHISGKIYEGYYE